MLLICLFLCISTQAPAIDDYFEKGKFFAEELLKKTQEEEKLRKTLSEIKSTHTQTPELPIKQGKCNVKTNSHLETSLYVFVSFSMPEESWLSLSKEVAKAGGVFVLRGLPGNSFKQLAEKLYSLRTKGLNAPIHVDPRLFQQYKIEKIPTFITLDKQEVDKLSGNVTLAFALEKMTNETAKKLRSHL